LTGGFLLRVLRRVALVAAVSFSGCAVAAGGPSAGLRPTDLALIVNTADPLSVAIGAYYAQKRRIPKANIAQVRFDPLRDDIPIPEFEALKSSIDRRLSAQLQAYVLTWARPYRVGCKSITSAFAFGSKASCSSPGRCNATTPNPYFNTVGKRPLELNMRLAMSLAALDLSHAKALIDRGEQSDGTAPRGTAYLITTTDVQRNVRLAEYPLAADLAARDRLSVTRGLVPTTTPNAMFYFVGAATVPNVERTQFLPGAVADHLTSFGGMLTDSPQMSSLRWLEAGATGSYGAVVEPCNFIGKFPHVAVLMGHYLGGETLIEAYWHSVQMPDEGIFIGEPLAAPFRTAETTPPR
jgi:uncharacterized protein (TIGR03790 family)